MCNPVQSIVDAIVGKIVEYIIGKVFQPVERHVGLLFHYQKNLKNLEEEMNNLQEQKSNIEGKVKAAKDRGEAINNEVSVWLKEDEETRQGVVKFMDEKKENMMCFNYSCPDFISRYRLSKQVEKKVVHVKHITAKGGEISTFSHPREAPLELEFPYSRDYEGFQSRYEVFTGIVEALKDPSVNIIGVYGTGGVGKTTMVTKVGELVKKDGTFDAVIIAVVSHDANVHKIQGQLAGRLKLPLGGETEEERATLLWNRLDNGKKNLIILDDVWQQWEELDLNKIGIPITDRNKSSKVVLTSRNQEVWKNMKDHKDFKIKFLSEGEAWTLFKKKVGNHIESPDQPLHGIAWAVCKECQGLPVAVNALGGALKNKEMHAWQDAFLKLKNSMLKDIAGINSKVFTSLKLSYDWLDSKDAKSCFLLCCLFPEDVNIPIDDLVRYYMAGRISHQGGKPNTLEEALYRVCTVVDTLKGCCLLLDGQSKRYVKMHDVVRDVAISIAKDEKSFLVKQGFRDWPDKATHEHCSVISLRPDDVREFPEELVSPELHMLRLDCTGNEFQLQVPDRFFSGTKNLVVLDLNGFPMFPLPSSLAKLAKLQMLCLNECRLGDIAILKDLKDHLEILSLRGSNIQFLPREVGELTRLRVLDMTDCHWLGMISRGVIPKLLRLEELFMPWSFGEWEGTSDDKKISTVRLDELMSLTQLTTLDICIRDPALLPKDGFFFEKLVRFRIGIGERGNYYDWDPAGVLSLSNILIENPLEYLLGKPKPKPKRSIERNGLYPSKSFSHLGKLCITKCTLKYLFTLSCARGLVQLESLEISSCSVMKGVIGTEGEKDKDTMIVFNRLKRLSLDDLQNFKGFFPEKEKTAASSGSSSADAQMVLFNDKVAFPALESLKVDFIPKITEIWNKQISPIPEIATESSFCELLNMRIFSCNKLVNVVGACPKIEAIEMEKHKGKVVDDYVTRFPKLMRLELKHLPNLESFCSCSVRCEAQIPLFDHQVAFPAMEELEIANLPNITDIWDDKLHPAPELFYLLRKLQAFNCGKLMNVVPSNMLPQLRNLEVLFLHRCPMVEVIVDLEKKEEETQGASKNTIVPFPKLRNMKLKVLQKIKGLCAFRSKEQRVFNVQVALPKLEELYVDTFGERVLRQLTDASKLSLKRLGFDSCEEASTVVSPHLFRRLRFVDLLKVTSCRGAREVFHFDGLEVGEGQVCVGPLTQVRKVYLHDLPELTCLWNKDPHRLLRLQSLEYLTIENCPKLSNLFTASVAKALGGLKVLYLRSCSTMEAVIATDEGHTDVIDDDEIEFPKLEWLILKDLSNLKSFCTSNHNFNFPSLKRVVLKRCPKMQAFTSGSLHMPQILLTTRRNEWRLTIEDLNKHLEQQHLKGEETTAENEMFEAENETTAENEMHGHEDQFSFLYRF